MRDPDQSHQMQPIVRSPDGSGLIARCSCGWQSPPRSNGEFAHQAWERHAPRPRQPGWTRQETTGGPMTASVHDLELPEVDVFNLNRTAAIAAFEAAGQQHWLARVPLGYAGTRYEDVPAVLRDRRFHSSSEEHTSEPQSPLRISSAVFCLTK